MRYWILRYRWPIVALLLLVTLLAVVKVTAAQPPVPHGVIEGDDCLSCHEAGVADALRIARDHAGRLNEDCGFCHEHSGSLADDIPHPVAGREDCLSCHSVGIGTILARSHLDRTNDMCRLCHLPSSAMAAEPTTSPAAVEPTPSPAAADPTPSPDPPSTPEAGFFPSGAETCAACHQRMFADEGHTLFTGQPTGDQKAGATLFAQQCATCHGKDGTTPVGDEEIVINAETYWGTHDDADILKDIGIEPHSEKAGFAQDYGGPLSWEEILDLTAFVRSWGPMSAPPVMPGPTYASTIGPLLTERCGGCHGAAAGLSVTDYDALMAGSSAGPVVVPGDPDGSPIVEVLQGEHYAQLSEAELNLLIEWIANGAPESTGVKETALPPESHPILLIGAHQGATCEACHVEGEQAPDYVCTNCHRPPEDHLEETCDTCHTPEGWAESAASVVTQSPQIPHTLDGRDDCLLCHDPAGQIKPAPADHERRGTGQCTLCHKLAP